MILKNLAYKVKCDIPGCKNFADFAVEKFDNTTDCLKLCNDCLIELNECIIKKLKTKNTAKNKK